MMRYNDILYTVEPMQGSDVEEVMEIESISFSLPWTAGAYRYELRHNALSHYFVLRQRKRGDKEAHLLTKLHRPLKIKPPILGYGGFWMMGDEAHIGTLAVKPEWRGRGLGELILVAMLDRAVELGAAVATLEVRVSNIVAQNLYRKYGFKQVGLRRRYYSDSGEDALIMTTDCLSGVAFQRNLQRLKKTLKEKLGRLAPSSVEPACP